MKNLFLYLILLLLGLSIIVAIDLLAGLSFSMALRSIYSGFTTTTLQESIAVVIFLSIPFIQATTTFIKKRSKQANK